MQMYESKDMLKHVKIKGSLNVMQSPKNLSDLPNYLCFHYSPKKLTLLTDADLARGGH